MPWIVIAAAMCKNILGAFWLAASIQHERPWRRVLGLSGVRASEIAEMIPFFITQKETKQDQGKQMTKASTFWKRPSKTNVMFVVGQQRWHMNSIRRFE